MEIKEMTIRERAVTGSGIVIGGLGLVIITNIILNKMKVTKFPLLGFLGIIVLGAAIGGFYGNRLGKKWQANADKK